MARKQYVDIPLNLNVHSLQQSATLTINKLSAWLYREGREILESGSVRVAVSCAAV